MTAMKKLNVGNGNPTAAVVNSACQYDRNGKNTWSRGISPGQIGRISRQGIRRRRACRVVIYDEDGNIRTGKARKSGAIHTGRIWEWLRVSIWSVTPVYAYAMSFGSPSFIAPTLGMSGWLVLTQQGLSPCKTHQASLGAHGVNLVGNRPRGS